MTGLIVTPDLAKVMVRREGIFTVDAEMASLICRCVPESPVRGACGGIDIDKIPLAYRMFQLAVEAAAKRFIARQKPRGFEFPESGRMELHGPWPSLDLGNTLQDLHAPSVAAFGRREKDGFEHPELATSVVIEATHNLKDYLLVGEFLFQDRMTDLELPE